MKNMALLALLAALAGCAMPPYSQELSLAQLTRRKLGAPVLKIGPVYAKLDDSASRDRYFFLPDRDTPLAGGFLVRETSFGLWIWCLADYSSNTSLGGNHFAAVEMSGETSISYFLQPIKSTGSFDLALVRYTPSDDYDSTSLHVIRATDPSAISQYSATKLNEHADVAALGLGSITFAGSSLFPLMPAYAYDQLFFLAYRTDLGTYYEVSAETDASGMVNLSLLAPLPSGFSLAPPLPAGLRNAFYGNDAFTGQSFLSYRSGAGYRSYAWDAATAPSGLTELTGVKGPIVAVLSNGQLLCIADSTCTIYTRAGSKVCDFPVGDLKYCFETTNGTAGTVYFSLAYWLWGRDEQSDKLYVEVYAIPTAQLEDLR